LRGKNEFVNRGTQILNNKEALQGVKSVGHTKLNISCQYLHFAQTEDIWLKSALEGKRGVSLTSGRS
jgi:hypothetical protein